MMEPIALRGREPKDLDLLAAMEKIRGIELALRDGSISGRLEGPVHVSMGEEAVAVGVAAAMQHSDVLLSNHRGHGHALAFGLDPYKVVAEVVGHQAGYSGGRGGSMHLFDPDSGFLGTNGIVGGNAGVAVGAGLALQHEDSRRAAVVIFGDGAMATGVVYEAFNLAVLWELPVVFVCENNGYAELTPTAVHLSSAPVERAKGFGLQARQIDGTDVGTVIAGMTWSLEHARQGRPAFLEQKCYRFGGHYAADPARYRPAGEDDEWQRLHCPVRKLGRSLHISEDELSARVDSVRHEASKVIEALAA